MTHTYTYMKIKKPREINVQTLFHYWANNAPNLALTIGLVAEIPQIVEMLKKKKNPCEVVYFTCKLLPRKLTSSNYYLECVYL